MHRWTDVCPSAAPTVSDPPAGGEAALGEWHRAARDLLATFGPSADHRGGPVWLVLFEASPGAVARLGVRDSPEGLAGWSAPAHCRAVGVVAGGRVVRGATGPRDVQLCCLVSRDGTIGWHTAPPGAVPETPPEGGRIVDTLKRCLGLPTPHEPEGVEILLDLVWLMAVLDAAAGASRELGWDEVIHLYPAPGRTSRVRLSADGLPGSPWTWEDVRCATARGRWPDGPVSARLARWMDEGMFARSVLEATPDLGLLAAEARRVVGPEAGRRLAEVFSRRGHGRVA
jgi:hypothetical protein